MGRFCSVFIRPPLPLPTPCRVSRPCHVDDNTMIALIVNPFSGFITKKIFRTAIRPIPGLNLKPESGSRWNVSKCHESSRERDRLKKTAIHVNESIGQSLSAQRSSATPRSPQAPGGNRVDREIMKYLLQSGVAWTQPGNWAVFSQVIGKKGLRESDVIKRAKALWPVAEQELWQLHMGTETGDR